MSGYVQIHLVQNAALSGISNYFVSKQKKITLPEVNGCIYCMYVHVFVCGDGGYYVIVNGVPPALSFTHKHKNIKKLHAPHSSALLPCTLLSSPHTNSETEVKWVVLFV